MNTRDRVYIFARGVCCTLDFISFLIMLTVPHYNPHLVFTLMENVSPIPVLWNFLWSIFTQGGMIHPEQHHILYSCVVLADWLMTGLTTVPACLAIGVVVFLDFDTHRCTPSSQLSEVCTSVEISAGLYLLAGCVNLAIALLESWEFAATFRVAVV